MNLKITGDATAEIEVQGHSPITVIGTEKIRQTFDKATIQQAVNARCSPGVTDVVLNPDAHVGYGAPIGCVMVSPDYVYPGPVGVDVKCSMSLIQFDLPAEEIQNIKVRRSLIETICDRTPTGPGQGQRNVKKPRLVSLDIAKRAIIEGPCPEICDVLKIPYEWTQRCEDSFHLGHDRSRDALRNRLENILDKNHIEFFDKKMSQLGSYGGGNHFGECEITQVEDNERARKCAEVFGLKDGCVSFLSHCGSRGFGNVMATEQFRILRKWFQKTKTPFPGGDSHLVYAKCGSSECNDYLDDMALAANFATVNHLLINSLVLEAFQEVFPGIQANFVYLISHNIVRREILDGRSVLVHRKGATRAFPANHPGLQGTPFESTGHPILLPGNPVGGSAVMVA
ncbi:MAG: RtcB family protein, partial [Thermoguttaceae bacterium]|nr:RtcB family protein [Thermoguttaceae bacterium]